MYFSSSPTSPGSNEPVWLHTYITYILIFYEFYIFLYILFIGLLQHLQPTSTSVITWDVARSVASLAQYLPDSASGRVAVAEVFRLIDQAGFFWCGSRGVIKWDPFWGDQTIPRHPVIFLAEVGVSNHLLSIVFRFHYHSQKMIGSLGNANVR